MPLNQFEAGRKKSGGRKPGIPNRVTSEFKEALIRLLNKSAPKMIEWLEQVDDPGRRLEILCRLAEYIYPKLGRQELTAADGKPLTVSIAINGIQHEKLGHASDAGALPGEQSPGAAGGGALRLGEEHGLCAGVPPESEGAESP